MTMAYSHRLTGWRPIAAAVLLGGLLLVCDTASAFLYCAPAGSLKDNCVVWRDGTFYLFTMYRREQQIDDVCDQWRHVWLATSTDGVHWKDVGAVIHDAPFVIFAMRVWKAGDRYLMNHGSFTGDKQDVLRLWESPDLVHWTYLGPEFDIRRPDGQRIDHMDVIAELENGKTVYYGYAVGGILRSEDGMHWNWIGDFPFTDNLNIRVVQEPGGCQHIGDLFYLLVGGFYPGSFEYAVATFVSEKPTGPFRPDYPAFRLNGYSGRNVVALWAGYCRTPNEPLLTNYILDPGGRFWWHAPLKSAVVDGAKHLRMGYWKGNEALKGAELPCDMSQPEPAWPGAKEGLTAASDRVTIKAVPQPSPRWITPGAPAIGAAFLTTAYDGDTGFIVEGSLRVNAIHGLVFPGIGICLEEKASQAATVLFETWGQTEIGTLSCAESPRFTPEDCTAFGCATVAGIAPGATCHFRLLFRKNIFEMYLDDLLVQTYSTANATGRIGLVVQDGDGTLSDVHAWEMKLP